MPYFMYVSISQEDKVLIFAMDPETGQLEKLKEVATPGRPAPMAASPDRRFLYVGRRDVNEISSFAIDQSNGDLSLLGVASLESDPCFLSTDCQGKFLLSSYYNAGHAAVHPIGADGVAGPPSIEWLATGTGAHSIQTDPSNRFAFVPHIANRGGPNAIFQFKFDPDTGHLTPNTPPRVSPSEQLGPRHFCFHPQRDILYFSNEQACSITGYNFDRATGTLNAFQTVSTLPPDFSGQNTCSQIQIAPSGQFLYAPNRGHNSIACFAVDQADGRLTSLGQVPSETVPRAFSLDPQGKFLYAAGLESGRLASYRIDGDTGKLEAMTTYGVGQGPMWVLITRLPG